MFGLQPIHIVIIVVLAVLLFGPKKLPEFGKSLGRSIREFKSASKDITEDFKSAVSEESSEAAKKESAKKEAPKSETAPASQASQDTPSQPVPQAEPATGVARESAQS